MTTPRPTPNPGTSTNPQRSSKRIAHKKPLAWLPLALLLGLALLAALVLLAINAVDDDGPNGPAGDSLGQVSGSGGSGVNGSDSDAQQPTAGSDGSGAQQPTAAGDGSSAGSGSTGGSSGSAAGGSLKVGDQDLLALAGSSLTSRDGQPVSGTAKVQSVVSNEGFWVGESTAQRVFVYLTPQARQADGESKFQVEAGQTVQVTGELVSPSSSPTAVAGVTEAEGKAQLQKQGELISAATVELAG